MKSTRPFTFSATYVSPHEDVRERVRDWCAWARKLEDLGYTRFTMSEHYASIPGSHHQRWAPIPALMAVLDATTTLRICASFTPVGFHHPVVLAQEYATMDLLSEGRIDVGVGAGSFSRDFEAAGLPVESAGVRIRRLEEVIEVLKGLWGTGPFNFQGEFYQIDDIDGSPKPMQTPHPPIVVGGLGKNLLSVAGRHAQGINLMPGGPGPMPVPMDAARLFVTSREEFLTQKIDWIRTAAGPRFGEIEIGIGGIGMVTDDRDGFVDRMASRYGIAP